jgi:pyruvate dehydrogenase E2 component (dihydrolipoamide acetyltransferase)
MEVETDKATVEVESPASGILSGLTAAGDDDIAVGRPIAMILAAGESMPDATRTSSAPVKPTSTVAEAASPTAPVQARGSGWPSASPKARRLAEERGVDLSRVVGSGPGGAILEEDVLQAVARPATASATEPALWRAMAENVTRSWREAPHFFIFREVDAGSMVAERRGAREAVTYTDLLLRCVAEALARHPRMNGNAPDVNIGLAVAVPDGLIVPVIHGVDRLSVEEIAERRKDVVDRVRAGRMRATDLSGGTFTVSNLGMYEVDLFTAVLTEGQAGILAVGRITDRVVAREGAAVVRPTILMSLSCDHRQVDGARAAEFMQALVRLLEGRAI